MADNPFSNLNLPPRAAAQTGIFSVIDRLNNVPTQDQIMMGDKERIRQDDLGRSAGEREALSAIMQKVGEVRANNPDADPQSLDQPYSLWTLERLADYMAEQTGIRVSPDTVRRRLKAADIVLSRPQHKISSPDPEYEVKKKRSKKPETT
jgi:transposase